METKNNRKVAPKGKQQIKRKKYTASERKAYWIGVGASMGIHDSVDPTHMKPDERASFISGYEADNRKDLSRTILFGNVRRGK